MTLKELAKVLDKSTAADAEVRQETAKRDHCYDILCRGARSRKYADREVDVVYPIVFNGETAPSLVIWVKRQERK